jgi:site-specific DNA recombinase
VRCFAEDLDRACCDPRDLEDLIDTCEVCRASARSLSGSLTLTRGGTDTEITTARLMVTVKNAESWDKNAARVRKA